MTLHKDKIEHFIYWYTGTLTIGIICIPVAVILMALLGIIKELYDWLIKKEKFDFLDLLADGIGIGVAVLWLMIVAINL